MAEFLVRVIPRAKKTEAAGKRGDRFVIRLAAPPVDGAANDALIAFLASTFQVPRRAVRIVSGERAREKRVAIDGVADEQVRMRLDRLA